MGRKQKGVIKILNASKEKPICLHSSKVEGRAGAFGNIWLLFPSPTGIDCGMSGFMTLGKSHCHFSMPPLS